MIAVLLAQALAEEPAPESPPADSPPADSPPAEEGRGALEVIVEARRDKPVVAEHTLDRERVLLTPGTHEDAVRLVQSLPGVALTPEYSPSAGDIAVRGSHPDESRYLLDGIELPYLYHYNGYSSVFPARLLDELQLYPSTFGAQYGDATGAIVDTKSTWDRPDSARASLQANFIMVGGEATGPSGEQWNVRVSGRRSYLDVVEGSSEQYTLFPVFSDWYARIEHTPTPNARWSLTGLGASDAYNRYAGEPDLLDTYEQSTNPVFAYAKAYNGAVLSHRHLFGANKLEGAIAAIGYQQTGVLPSASSEERLLRVHAREDGLFALGSLGTLAAGVEGKFESTALNVETDRSWPELVRETPLLVRGVGTDTTIDRLIAGAYAEGRFAAGDFRFTPGLRLDGDTLTETVTADPRLNVRWQIGPDERLRLAAGKYTQFPRAEWLAEGVGNPDIGPATSWQAAMGFDYAFAGRLELAIDGYYKASEGLVEVQPDSTPTGDVTGTAWGVELQSRYRIRNLFFASIGVSVGESTRNDHPSDYDQPWALNLIGSWNAIPTWNLGLRYRASAGLPYTPIVDGTYEGTTDGYTPTYGETNSARLPFYQKVDVHIQKDWTFRTWNLSVYSELWFVPPGSDVMYTAWNYDYDDEGNVTGPLFIPLLGARGEWGGK